MKCSFSERAARAVKKIAAKIEEIVYGEPFSHLQELEYRTRYLSSHRNLPNRQLLPIPVNSKKRVEGTGIGAMA